MDNEKKLITEDDEMEVIELVDEDGKATQFYLIETREYKGKPYAVLSPAEEIDGLDEDTILIFEISGDSQSGLLLPIEDEVLLEEIYNDYISDIDGEYVEEQS